MSNHWLKIYQRRKNQRRRMACGLLSRKAKPYVKVLGLCYSEKWHLCIVALSCAELMTFDIYQLKMAHSLPVLSWPILKIFCTTGRISFILSTQCYLKWFHSALNSVCAHIIHVCLNHVISWNLLLCFSQWVSYLQT